MSRKKLSEESGCNELVNWLKSSTKTLTLNSAAALENYLKKTGIEKPAETTMEKPAVEATISPEKMEKTTSTSTAKITYTVSAPDVLAKLYESPQYKEATKRMEEYAKNHPIPDTSAPVPSYEVPSKPERIDYRKFECPDEIRKQSFTKDWEAGEVLYWEGGLREKLLTEGKKSYFVATDGKMVELAPECNQLLFSLFEKYGGKQCFFIARVGEETTPMGSVLPVTTYNFGHDNRPRVAPSLSGDFGATTIGPVNFLDDTGSSTRSNAYRS